MKNRTVKLGDVCTIGELRKRLSAFTDDCPFSFDAEMTEVLCLYYHIDKEGDGRILFTVERIEDIEDED